MEIIYVLVPLGLVLLAAAIWAFFWAVKNDQFDDLEGPAYSILFDDPEDQQHKIGEETKSEEPSTSSDDSEDDSNETSPSSSKPTPESSKPKSSKE